MGNQHLASYFFRGLSTPATTVDVYGCWDSQTPDGAFDFYDLYDADSGACLNEGEPLHAFPSWQKVLTLVGDRETESVVAAQFAGIADLCSAQA